MKRNLISFVVVLVAIATIFISYQTKLTNFAAKSDSSVVTVRLSGWGASQTEQKLLKEVLKDFEVANPGIKVKFEQIPDQYMDVIKTRLIGDAGPDVFYLDGYQAPFLMSQDVLEPNGTKKSCKLCGISITAFKGIEQWKDSYPDFSQRMFEKL